MKKIFTFALGFCLALTATAQNNKTVSTAADLTAAFTASYDTVFVKSETELNIKKAALPTSGTLRVVGVPREDGSKPVVKMELTVPTNTEADHLSLIFENLVLDNSNTPNLGGTASKYHFSYKDSVSHYADTIAFRNCEIRNVVRGFYRAQNLEVAAGGYNDGGCINTFEVTGCTFHQIPQNNLFALFYMGQRVNEMTFRNNVFYDIPGLKGIVQFAYMDDNSGREDIVFTFENNDVFAHPSQHLFLFDSFVGQMSEFHINNNFFLTPDWKDDYNNYYIDTDSIARLKDASIARIQYGVNIDIHNNVLYKYKGAEDTKDDEGSATWIEGCYEEVDFSMADVDMTWGTFGDAQNDDFSYVSSETVATAGVDGAPIGSTDLIKYLQNPVTFTATANVEQGSVSPAKGTYEKGEAVTVTAVEQPGVSFVEWRTADGTFVSNDNPYTFTLDTDIQLVAIYEIMQPVTVNFTIESPYYSEMELIVSPEQETYYVGDEIDVTIKDHCLGDFIGWSDGETEMNRHFTLTGNLDLRAKFDHPHVLVAVWDFCQITKGKQTLDNGVAPNHGDSIGTFHTAYWTGTAYKDSATIMTRNNKFADDLRICAVRETPVDRFDTNPDYNYAVVSTESCFDVTVRSFVGADAKAHKNQLLQYSLDGINYTTLATTTLEAAGTWYPLNATLPKAAEYQPAVYLRWIGETGSGVVVSPDNTTPVEELSEFSCVAGIQIFGKDPLGEGVQSAVVPADNVCYDLQGRAVAHPQKGIYILGGKKILVK